MDAMRSDATSQDTLGQNDMNTELLVQDGLSEQEHLVNQRHALRPVYPMMCDPVCVVGHD